MEQIVKDITGLVGGTPLLEAGRFFPRERGGRLRSRPRV